MRHLITKRLDPWHKQTYRRVLHDERPEQGRCRVLAMNGELPFDRVAFVSVPWSDERVRVVWALLEHAGRTTSLGWFFVA
jgi:hypothetical protein